MQHIGKKKVFVTGADGFIGRHVISELSNNPVEIIAAVRDLKKPSPVFKFPSVSFFQVDLASPPEKLFDLLGRPDVLIHLAWGGLPNYQSLHHFEQELPMQYDFLSQLVRSGLESIVVSGTCFEYGLQSGRLSEGMKGEPNTPYAYAKDALRRQLNFLRETCPFALTWARFFYLYGEGQSEKSLWTQLMRSVNRGEEVFNMSGGEQLRDYLHVTKVAETIVTLALNQADIGEVNICSGTPISIRKLVEGWIEENGWKIKLNLGYYPYPVHEPMAFWGDRSRLDHFLSGF